jgi:hypothetical protein
LTSSWKIGAVSGLIAGIIAGIIAFFLAVYHLENGFPYWGLEILETIPTKEIAIVEIPFYTITGIVFGIMFSKVYDLIPGKSIVKGFVAGLILYLIFSIRWYTFSIMLNIPNTNLHYIVIYVPMGLITGISYAILNKRDTSNEEKFATKTYDLKGVFYPGAIAGIVSGITSFLAAWLIINPLMWQRFSTDVGFLMSQLGTLVMFDMIWGIVFGVLFAMFYEKIPGKGIFKGLIFAISVYFFTNLPTTVYHLMYYQLLTLEYEILIWGIWSILTGLSVFIPFGIVLGLLYRKPTEVTSVKEEETQVVKISKCIHCGFSIPRDSKFCKECGKKQ